MSELVVLSEGVFALVLVLSTLAGIIIGLALSDTGSIGAARNAARILREQRRRSR